MTRLRHRAVTIALSSLLVHLQDVVSGKRVSDAEASELYLVLHGHLRTSWKDRFLASRATLAFQTFVFGNGIVAITVNIIAGSCITAASILYIASIAISALVVNAANYAAANAESAAVASAYRGARVRIHEMLVRAANSRAADPAGVAELQTHERALQVLAEDGADCAERVLGVAVDSGAARSMVVGALTVGLGLYSIFRSAGIFATVQIFAPSV